MPVRQPDQSQKASLPEERGSLWPIWVALLASRGTLLLVLALIPGAPRPGDGVSPFVPANSGLAAAHHPSPYLDAFCRNDGTYYLQIAALGYGSFQDQGSLKEGFFAGYPWLVRGVGWLLKPFLGTEDPLDPLAKTPYLVAGLIVSHVALIVALLLFVALGRRYGLEAAAVRGAVALLVCPWSFVLSCVMSESVFLCAVLAAFLAAERGRFQLAGFAGAFAAITRILGLVLWPALTWMALWSSGLSRERFGRILAALLVPIGLCLLLLAMGRASGDPWIYFRVQETFGHEGFPTFHGIVGLFQTFGFSPLEPWRNFLHVVVLATAVILLLIQLRLSIQARIPWVWLAYTAPMLAAPVLAGSIISLPRYFLTLFPLFMVLGLSLPRGRAGYALSGAAIAAQAALFWTWEGHWPLVI